MKTTCYSNNFNCKFFNLLKLLSYTFILLRSTFAICFPCVCVTHSSVCLLVNVSSYYLYHWMGVDQVDVFDSILKESLNLCTISGREELPEYMFYDLVVPNFWVKDKCHCWCNSTRNVKIILVIANILKFTTFHRTRMV